MEIEVDYLAQLNPADAIGLLDGDDLTGLMLWPSAQFLAQFLASHGQKQLAGARVIELGAGGTGLPGLAAAQFCHSVLLTDINPTSLQVLRINAARNDHSSSSSSSSRRRSDGDGDDGGDDDDGHGNVEVRDLAWGKGIAETELRGCFDVVVGADVIYDFEGIELIAASIELLLANPTESSCAILTFTERLEEYRPALAAACEKHNLRLASVLVQQECEYGTTITILIHSADCRDPASLVQSWTLASSLEWALTTEKQQT